MLAADDGGPVKKSLAVVVYVSAIGILLCGRSVCVSVGFFSGKVLLRLHGRPGFISGLPESLAAGAADLRAPFGSDSDDCGAGGECAVWERD